MPKRRAEARASDKDGRAKRSRSRKGMASLPRRIWGDVKLYGSVFTGVGTFVGLLGFSRLVNISIVTSSMLVVFLFRRKETLLILRRLYVQSAFYAYLYAVVFVAVVTIVGYSAFLVGKQAGYASGVRSVLTSLDLPIRPLPLPHPRFPGDVNLDEYCRSQGPFEVRGPDSAITAHFEGGGKVTIPLIPDDQKQGLERAFGKSYLVCAGRIRRPINFRTERERLSQGESEGIIFKVDQACAWQYPGQRVHAIAPKDRNDVDAWRCYLDGGPPATWP
jgi:hypothetical protein